MESFIEDLLNLHMMNQGVFELKVEPFSPQSAIDFVLDMIRLKAREKGIDVSAKNSSSINEGS